MDTMARYAYALANLTIPPVVCRDCHAEIDENPHSVALMRPDGRPWSATYCGECWRARGLAGQFDPRSKSELDALTCADCEEPATHRFDEGTDFTHYTGKPQLTPVCESCWRDRDNREPHS